MELNDTVKKRNKVEIKVKPNSCFSAGRSGGQKSIACIRMRNPHPQSAEGKLKIFRKCTKNKNVEIFSTFFCSNADKNKVC